MACQGNLPAALEKAELCCNTLAAKPPSNHSILATAFNRVRVILAANRKYEAAIQNFEEAQNIIEITTGQKSMQNMLTNFNKFLVHCVKANAIDRKQLEENLVKIHSMLPEICELH